MDAEKQLDAMIREFPEYAEILEEIEDIYADLRSLVNKLDEFLTRQANKQAEREK